MKKAHTPGPWRMHYDEDGYTGEIRGALDSDYDGCIADWVAEANARLIAAAPDLLEALEELEGYIDGVIEDGCPKCGGDCSEANPPVSFCPIQQANKDLLKARAAIARAKGEA